MMDTIPFQYALFRFTGDVETDEFVNVGLALYSSVAHYLRIELLTRYERITDLFPDVDGEFYRQNILRLQKEFDDLVQQVEAEREQERLPALKEFSHDLRFLLQVVLSSPDAALRVGETHFGVTADLDEMFRYLYGRLILQHLKKHETASRDDDAIWNVFKRPLQEQKVLGMLKPAVIKTKRENQSFEHTWQNGRLNVLLPQSFDLVRAHNLREKAHRIIGKATVLQDSTEKPHMVVLVGIPRSTERDILRAYGEAKGMIQDQAKKLSVELVEEDKAEFLATRVKQEIELHH